VIQKNKEFAKDDKILKRWVRTETFYKEINA
jgi:hypothetical protein